MKVNVIFQWICLLFCCCLFACTPEQTWQLNNVAGHLPDLQFALTADNGKPLTAADYQGEIVLLYFGFTQCPDECPTTMVRLADIFKKLSNDANKVQVLFVSIDPDHDKPQLLHDYLAMFNGKHMTGLTGDKAAITALAKRYRIAVENSAPGNEITHSDTVFIFDRHGHARLLLTPDDPDSALLHDLKQLSQ